MKQKERKKKTEISACQALNDRLSQQLAGECGGAFRNGAANLRRAKKGDTRLSFGLAC